MKKAITRLALVLVVVAVAGTGLAQSPYGLTEASFDKAIAEAERRVQESTAKLEELRKRIADEKIPLDKELNSLETDLRRVREEFQQTSRELENRTLNVTNLITEIDSRKGEALYLSNLLGDYGRELEAGLHIAELQRYEDVLGQASLAFENSNLSEKQVYEAQIDLLIESFGRLEEALGGATFQGTALDSESVVKDGTFVLLGPAAIFFSDDGTSVGTIEQRIKSLEPTVVPFLDEEDALAVANLTASGSGEFPLDPTLGNAHKMESIQEETLWQEVNKGGAVMVPIFILAALALLVALFKWATLAVHRKPSPKKISALLVAVAAHDEEAAEEKARSIRGPVGKMLTAGVEHIRQPRELIEEVMYEKVLATRLKLQRFLPFIAICAASAPLLGLLGTVTGIIKTFKLITVFGSGDVSTLSDGISEALITTKFGLIVAIPSLLLHALLSRKARGIVDQMEKAAVALINQVAKTPYRHDTGTPHQELVTLQVKEALDELLVPMFEELRRELGKTPPASRRGQEDSKHRHKPIDSDGRWVDHVGAHESSDA